MQRMLPALGRSFACGCLIRASKALGLILLLLGAWLSGSLAVAMAPGQPAAPIGAPDHSLAGADTRPGSDAGAGTGALDVAPWNRLPPVPPLPKPRVQGYAAVNGVRLFYAIFGTGSPVLLLHGGLANSNYWGNVIPVLVEHGREVIVMDSRGHGRSSRDRRPFGYDLMANDVAATLDVLKIPKVDLVGWSDGGIIGLDIAMRHPERLRHLYAFGANADPSGVKDVSANPTFMRFVARTRSEFQALSPTPRDYDAFVEQIQAMWAHQPNFAPEDLRRISVPTAIADGAHDEAIKREHTEYLARTIPGARLVILPDVSHFAMLQDPRAFAASVLSFLSAP